MNGLGLFSECLGPAETSKCTMKAEARKAGRGGTSREADPGTARCQGPSVRWPYGPCQPKSWRLPEGESRDHLLCLPMGGQPPDPMRRSASLGQRIPSTCLSVLHTSPRPLGIVARGAVSHRDLLWLLFPHLTSAIWDNWSDSTGIFLCPHSTPTRPSFLGDLITDPKGTSREQLPTLGSCPELAGRAFSKIKKFFSKLLSLYSYLFLTLGRL